MFQSFLDKILQIRKNFRLTAWLIVLIISASVLYFGQSPVFAEDVSSTTESSFNPETTLTESIINETDNTDNTDNTGVHNSSSTPSENPELTNEPTPTDVASSTDILMPDNENNATPIIDSNATTSTPPVTENSSSTDSTNEPADDSANNFVENDDATPLSLDSDSTTIPETDQNQQEKDHGKNDNKTEKEDYTQNNQETTNSANSEDPKITTGNAFAVADILNVINTNIIDSNGFLSFLNLFKPLIGNIDVSNLEFPSDPCANGGCDTTMLVSNNSTSTVENNVVVEADTGSNVARGDASIIRTGSSVASANVVNIVNTNIIASNYLLLVLNNFNSWIGDLVLPGKDFFVHLLNQSQQSSDNAEDDDENDVIPSIENNTSSTSEQNSSASNISLNVSNDNSASIANNVQTVADTGNNAVSGNDSTITTGQAQSAANIFTMANSNFVGNNSTFILIRVFGNWNGHIFGLPPGISWKATANGILLFSDPVNTETDSQNDCCGENLTVNNANSADIINNVQVFALTGENEVDGDNSAISTGDAVAVANIANIVNTNIIGRNWLLAIANIFGDWQGDLAFGRPDLWIGQRAEVSSNPLVSGSEITFIVDLANRGNADATDINLASSFDPQGKIEITNFNGGEEKDGELHWSIPSLASGASTTITYTARVGSDLPSGVTTLTTNTTTTSFETDADPNNNSDSLTLTLQGPPIVTATAGGGGGSGGTNEYGNGLPKISMTKTNDTTEPIAPSSTVKYKLHITNDGTGSAFGVVVKDTLYDPWGTVVASNSWPLDIVYPNEDILIDYETSFSTHASSGYYINVAQLEGDNFYRDDLPSSSASSSVYLINPNDKINENAGNTTVTQISDGDFHATGNATSTTNNILPVISASPKLNKEKQTNDGLNVALAANDSPIVPENTPSRSRLSSLLASLKDTIGSIPKNTALLILVVALIALVALIRFSKK